MPTDVDLPDSPKGPALRDAKLALRRRVLGVRDALPAQERAAAGARIAAGIAALPSFAAARTVLLTLPFRSEWDTRPLVRAALASGKTVAVPRVDAALASGKTVAVPRVDAAARMLTLHAISDFERDVAPGHQGIPEPLPHCRSVAPGEIDWVLVPGVAFDRNGQRLGYGGGYYDRLLPLVPGAAPRVAGAYDAQIVDRVPAGPQDAVVDAIVTESRLLVPGARDPFPAE